MNIQKWLGLTCVGLAMMTPAFAGDEDDYAGSTNKRFGFVKPIGAPADASDYVPRAAAKASDRIKLAKGLQVEFVTRSVAVAADMIAFWPNATNPTHLIVCIEQDRAAGGVNPGVQRVALSNGAVETILYGTDSCDGIRTTPWGTILATEETDTGRAYEILNPLTTTGHWVQDRASGLIRTQINGAVTSTAVVQRQALPTMAWEGLAVLPSGVVIAGDELRPGTGTLDRDGGAIFKFIPDVPRLSPGAVSSLSESPLASGRVYAMSISCQGPTSSSFPQFGQGCEIGVGGWVRVNALTARADALARGATGYYRPEDLHEDPAYKGEGVRFCWANTGNESAANYAEILCAIDRKPMPAVVTEYLDTRLPAPNRSYLADGGTTRDKIAVVEANRFVEGDLRFNSFDNLEFQPKTGNVYVIEDHQYGEVFACLPDGDDRDIKTDACEAVLSVIDPLAEPTGFIFDASGEVAYVIVQHGETPASLGPTDDILKITGFKVKK